MNLKKSKQKKKNLKIMITKVTIHLRLKLFQWEMQNLL